nr:hypothetical protein [uncultured archaeon]AQS34136.1 hypothetical protein [uncultured archaeon]
MINLGTDPELMNEIEMHRKRFVNRGRDYTKGYIDAFEDNNSSLEEGLACLCALYGHSEIPENYVRYWGAVQALNQFPKESQRRVG